MSDGGVLTHILDIVNPPGTFKNGKRQREYSSQNVLPTSARRLAEFDIRKRQNIKDMFTRKKSTLGTVPQSQSDHVNDAAAARKTCETSTSGASCTSVEDNIPGPVTGKRPPPPLSLTAKRSKTKANSNPSAASASGQKTLKGFFKLQSASGAAALEQPENVSLPNPASHHLAGTTPSSAPTASDSTTARHTFEAKECQLGSQVSQTREFPVNSSSNQPDSDMLANRIANREDWNKLFTKKRVPRCDGHEEPCISLTTKKAGVNCGRAFWICSRPLGPSGEKEKSSEWRCPTFIWASDWNGLTPDDS